MVADSNAIVYRLERIQEQFSSLTQMVTGPETRSATAVEMECQLFRALLELGRQLLLVFFETRASIRPETPVAADGSLLAESRLRPKTYLSVFGKLRFERDRFFAVGKAAESPLDAELSLPEHCYSPLLRDWVGHELVESPYGISAQVLERILGLKLSKNALETMVGEDAREVDDFYEQKPEPEKAAEGPILVAQADGAGVRLVETGPSERTGHQTSKREAVVTAVYTIDPYRRLTVTQFSGQMVAPDWRVRSRPG